jgi:hypothetical protein
MNCGNISAGVPVFALMKNMVPGVKDGLNTIRVYSTNTKKMMYLTVDVLNGEARVDGDCEMAGVPGTGSKVLVDFREQRVPSPASSSLQAASWTRSRWMTGPRSTSQSRTWLTPASSSRPRTSVSDGARASQSRLVAERTARRDIDNELGFGKRLSLRLENGEASGLRRSGTRRRTALRAHRCQAGPGGRRIWPVRNGSHVVGEFIPRRRAASCSVSRPKFRGVGEVRSLS